LVKEKELLPLPPRNKGNSSGRDARERRGVYEAAGKIRKKMKGQHLR
jgi:hypothetical protein